MREQGGCQMRAIWKIEPRGKIGAIMAGKGYALCRHGGSSASWHIRANCLVRGDGATLVSLASRQGEGLTAGDCAAVLRAQAVLKRPFVIRRLSILLWWLLLLAVAGGFAGVVHPAGDSLAVFRPYLAGLLGVISVCLLGLRARRAGVVGLLAMVGAGASVFDMHGAEPAVDGGLSVYQKNLLFRLKDPRPLLADIRVTDPDVITLQEVTRRNRPILRQLSDVWSAQQFCTYLTVGGTAVLSRWPKVPDSGFCRSDIGLVGMQVETPEGRLWLLSVHLHWPWPHRQPESIAGLIPVLQALEGPIVLGGDFNMVPWSHSLRSVAKAGGMQIGGRPGGSYDLVLPWLRLPIDHVLVPGAARATAADLRPKFGSDHRGVVASFTLREP